MGTCRCRFCRAFSINRRLSGEMVAYQKIVLCCHVTSELSVTDDENEKISETKTPKVQHICDRQHFDFVRNTHTEAQPLEYTVLARPCEKNALIRSLVMNLSSQSSTSYYCVC